MSCKLEMHSIKRDRHKEEKQQKMSVSFLLKSHASFDTDFHLGCFLRQTPERACTKTKKSLREMRDFVKMNFRYKSVIRAFPLLLVQNREESLIVHISYTAIQFRGTWMGWRNGLRIILQVPQREVMSLASGEE